MEDGVVALYSMYGNRMFYQFTCLLKYKLLAYLCVSVVRMHVRVRVRVRVCVCIQMFMEIGDVPVAGQTVSGQGNLQMFLIFIAFVSVPCLLFPKPYLLKWEHEKNQVIQNKNGHWF